MANLSSFFDDVIEENCVETPVAVLKKLAEDLTNKTNGMLVGDVKQIVSRETNFRLEFYINAPVLNNYSFLAVIVAHDLGLYPLKIFDPLTKEFTTGRGTDLKIYEVENPNDFEEKLKQVFLSPATKRVINGLLAQIKSG